MPEEEFNPFTQQLDKVGISKIGSKIIGATVGMMLIVGAGGVLAQQAFPSFTESDPNFAAWLLTNPFNGYATQSWVNSQGFLKTESDPVFSAWATANDHHANWDTAYGWGNHASAGYLTSLSGALLATGAVTGASAQAQAFTNGIISPSVLGGSGTTQTLTFQTTSGVGATGANMYFKVGNNGSVTAMTILNSGNVGIGTTSPGTKLDVAGVIKGSAEVYASGGSAFLTSTQVGTNASNVYQMGSFNATGQIALYAGNAEWMRILSTGNVGIGTTSPTNILSFGGNAARTCWLERHTTSNTAGSSFTVQAGGATAAATDKAGGTLFLKPGVSTGTGESGVTIQGCVAGTTGTADGSFSDVIKVLGNKLGFYGVTPIVRAVLATGASHTVDDVITAMQNLGLVSQT